MAKLALKLDKRNLDIPVDNAAVVAIQQVADGQGRFPETPFEASVPIPAGPTPPLIVDVPDGRFTLTARMPSGATERKTVTVREDQTAPITFDTGHSAHEWLSWQTLAGAVPPSVSFASRGSGKQLPRSAQDRRLLDVGVSVFRSSSVDPFMLIRPFTAAGYLGFDHPLLLGDADLLIERTGSDFDAMAATWKVSADRSYPPDLGRRRERPVVWFDLPGARVTAPLPLPWAPTLDAAGNLAAVDLLVDLERETSRAVRVTLREPEFMALLSYLGAGRMTEAAASLGGPSLDVHVTRLIREKIDNPLAAAGAAYVGLATSGDESARRRWSPWLRNLMNWFPDLPDGAVLYARDLIERGRSIDDLLKAKEALKVAYERGLPLYVAGFRHLLDGLQLFADPDDGDLFDPQAKSMRARVARVAARVDPTQPFTVLTEPDY